MTGHGRRTSLGHVLDERLPFGNVRRDVSIEKEERKQILRRAVGGAADAGVSQGVLGGRQALRSEGLHPLVVAVDGAARVVDRGDAAVLVLKNDQRRVDVAGLADGRVDADRPSRVHLDDLASRDVPRHVEVVDRHVEEDPARHLDVRDGRRGGVATGDAHHFHVFDHATPNRVAHRLVGAVETTIEADLQRDTGRFDGLRCLIDQRRIHRDRLLAEDRLSSRGRGDHQRNMGVGAGPDRHRIDVG